MFAPRMTKDGRVRAAACFLPTGFDGHSATMQNHPPKLTPDPGRLIDPHSAVAVAAGAPSRDFCASQAEKRAPMVAFACAPSGKVFPRRSGACNRHSSGIAVRPLGEPTRTKRARSASRCLPKRPGAGSG